MRATLTAVLSLAITAAACGADDAVNELVSKLQSSDSDDRRAAAKSLGEMGKDAKGAVAALTRALSDKDLFVSRYAAEALGNIGPDAKAAIGRLSTLMGDERKEVSLAAVEAIGKMGAAGVAALTGALKDPNKDPQVRKRAAQGLGEIGLAARGAVPTLTDVVMGRIKGAAKPKGKAAKKGNPDDIRVDAAKALGSVAKKEDKAALAALRSVSEGKQRNRELQKAASDALVKLTGEPAKKAKKKKED